ncbi:MBL fold metallo-hydrolase, partial [Sellimonas intestinalis]|nr:MBL fold metallo-hydrolase [Sellimonas intestinalis]NSK47978.1 MBL fold metallo-hydrolase [Sellimonas intestinalis]NSK64575.1 MBL fold metallo-hydrolase [Sellimonas intestinalis]
YYFDKKTGEAKYGLIDAGNGYTYYFLEGGKWLTGLQEIEGKWYNFAGTGGSLTGWRTIDGKKYYFDPEVRYAVTGIKKIDGVIYQFSDDGVLQKEIVPGLTEEDGKLYYYDENGKKKTGFQIVDGKRYYFDKKTGEA